MHDFRGAGRCAIGVLGWTGYYYFVDHGHMVADFLHWRCAVKAKIGNALLSRLTGCQRAIDLLVLL